MFWLGWGKKIKEIFTKKEADRYYVKLSGDETINGNKTLNGTTTLGRVTNLGSNSNGDAFFLPKKDAGKSILYTGNSAFNDDKRFDIDLQNRSKILNVPNPTSDKDAANKFYVDGKIKYVTGERNIGVYEIVNIFNLTNKKLISFNVYRKYDGSNRWYQFYTDGNIGYDVIIEDNVKLSISNRVKPSSFLNTFKYEIVYMEN